MMNAAITSVLFASEGGAPTYESHHWLLPETFEIIYGGTASVLVIGALIKFAGPIIKKSLAARTERIQNEIDNARNARIAAARADADQKNAAARAAAQGDVAAAVATVASRVAELALGKAPDASVVNAAVASTMEGSRS